MLRQEKNELPRCDTSSRLLAAAAIPHERLTAAGPPPPADRSVFRRPEPLTSPPTAPRTELTNHLVLHPVFVTDCRGPSMPGPANQWEVCVYACFLPVASSASTAAEPIKAEQLPQPIQHHITTQVHNSRKVDPTFGFAHVDTAWSSTSSPRADRGGGSLDLWSTS